MGRQHRPRSGHGASGPLNGPQRAVLVVGAGPVGLSCALALRARGVEVTVLEARSEGEPRPGSRAIYTHRASLELFERMRPGLGSGLARRGLVWSGKRTFWRGREVFARSYPPPVPDVLPPFTSLPQTEIERHLIEACGAAGVEIAWDCEVQAITAGPGGVTATTPDGRVWAGEWVIGADGAHSTARRAIQMPMAGSRSENAYVIVDLDEDPDQPRRAERIFHYEHPAVGRRNVLLVPFRGGWRADLQCRSDDDPDELAGGDGLRSWVGNVMGQRYAERIRWVSTYRFLQVVARGFTDETRRVLLVGEAAHLFAPFGARGMNSGIADAEAAAAAIDVALGAADRASARSAIERFASDRREAAASNRRAAGKALAAIQGRGPVARAKRRTAVALAAHVERPAAWLDSAPYGPRLRSSRLRRPGY